MKKITFLFFGMIIASSAFSQIRVTGEMPDPNNVYNPPNQITSNKKTEDSLSGLYRMSDIIYTKNEDTFMTDMLSDYMLNISEITNNNYVGTIYGTLKYKNNNGINVTECGEPSVFLFSTDKNGVELSREIVKEGKCKLQKKNRKVRIGWKLENEKLVLTKSSGSECVVAPCGKLDRTVYIQKFDKTK